MEKLLIFVGMALATYVTRYAMIAALGREMPPLPPLSRSGRGDAQESMRLRRWLRYVPPAVLAALVVPAALAPGDHLEIGTRTWAVLAGAFVAWRTRSALWTVLGGMAAFWLLRLLGG